MAATRIPAVAGQGPVRWSTEHRVRLSEQFDLHHSDNQQGYSYKLADLTADYLRTLWQSDNLFNQTSNRTFNTNYRNWALRYRTSLERNGIRRDAFDRHSQSPGKYRFIFLVVGVSFFLFSFLTLFFLSSKRRRKARRRRRISRRRLYRLRRRCHC